jgi:hypothetical protein
MSSEQAFGSSHSAGEASSDSPAQLTKRAISYVVLWLWSVLRLRSEADRWHVLVACWAGLVDAPTPRVAAHLQVLLRFRDDTGGETPSRRPYNRWRDKQADRDELPSASAVANTFGGWPAAAQAIGAKADVDVLARRAAQTGRRLRRDELISVLRDWGATQPPKLTYRLYRAWALKANHDPDRSVPWVPVSRGTYLERFGGWAQALHAAGLIDDVQLEEAKADQIAPDARKLTPESMVEALQVAARALAPRRLTVVLYNTWRHRQMETGASQPPAVTTLQTRFGSWHDALHAAELIDTPQLNAGLRKGGRRAPDRHVLRCLRSAIEAIGPDLTRRQYRRWRERQLTAGMRPRPVSDSAIVNRFGGWPAAVRAATTVTPTTPTNQEVDHA